MAFLTMKTDLISNTELCAATTYATYCVDEIKRQKVNHRRLNETIHSPSSLTLSTTRTAMLLSPLALAACGGGEGDSDVESIVYDSTIRIKETYQTTSWQVTQMADGFWYAGEYNPPSLVYHHPKITIPTDVNNDNDKDVIVPFVIGYRSGVDSRESFMVLENVNGILVYSADLTSKSPFVAGAGRTSEIYLQAYSSSAFVTVNIGSATETEQDQTLPWANGDLTITLTDSFTQLQETLIQDITLPASSVAQRATAVNAHSLSIGDINGDGLDDILVGELSGAFALLQTTSGSFQMFTSDIFTAFSKWAEPDLGISTTSFLLDLHMNDFNSDGLDDIVVGWGHNPSLSRVFFNSSQGFSIENSITLPETVYGSNNIMHINTFSGDFSNDGTNDIIVVHTRFEPWYGGTHLQYLRNDGNGNFIDETSKRLITPENFRDTYGDRLEGNYDSFAVLDFDSDGDLDIVGFYNETEINTLEPFIFLNDGTGHFTLIDFPILNGFGGYALWADFDEDGTMELLTYQSSWDDASGTSSTNFFKVYVFEDTLNDALNSYV